MTTSVLKPLKGLSCLFAAASILAFSGCGPSDYLELIGKYQESVNLASVCLADYYRNINESERDIYIRERLLNGKLPFYTQTADPQSKTTTPTPLMGLFSEASIQARIDTITLLGLYGERLSQIASNDSAAQFATNARVLGENLDSLSSRFSNLKNDATAPKYAGPIGTIVGIVGQSYLEHQQMKALKRGITDGSKAVNEILDLLEKDIVGVTLPLQTTGEMQILSERIAQYNTTLLGEDEETRSLVINEIKDSVERYQKIQASNPAPMIQSMRDANNALEQYLKSDRKLSDVKNISAALQLFKNRVVTVSNAVVELNKAIK
jgi:hypothetical protein